MTKKKRVGRGAVRSRLKQPKKTPPAAAPKPLVIDEKRLFKVVSEEGASLHNGGGRYPWSLPKDGKPGDWHEEPGTILMCARGLHLTAEPARWWAAKCRVFEVEAEGVLTETRLGVASTQWEGDKVVAKRVRLLRELSVDELASVGIIRDGKEHVVKQGIVVVEKGSVTAYGSSSVTAYGSSSVKAYGSSSVTACDSSSVKAFQVSTVVCHWGSAVKVEAVDRAVFIDQRGTATSVNVAGVPYTAPPKSDPVPKMEAVAS